MLTNQHLSTRICLEAIIHMSSSQSNWLLIHQLGMDIDPWL